MRLSSLRLLSFRAHTATEISFSERVNVIVGPNGAGKTNLLEAIGYLCLGKSIFGSNDQHVLRRGHPYFEIEGRFVSSQRGDVTIRLATVPGEGKRAFVNGVVQERLSSLVGRVPFVLLSPADYELTAGGPSERRRFLDATLSQSYPVYLDDLLKYRRAVKQTNALLLHARRRRLPSDPTLDAWREEVALLGSRIMERRDRFVAELVPFVEEAYRLLGEPGSELGVVYNPSVSYTDHDFHQLLRSEQERTLRRSLDLGRLLVGPHLDEVDFTIGGFDVRPFASQGQHRTFSLALRIAQALFLKERLEEDPLLLLDDVFGPLDPDRTKSVLDLLVSGAIGQSLVTAARREPFEGLVPFDTAAHSVFHVEHGEVQTPPHLTPPDTDA